MSYYAIHPLITRAVDQVMRAYKDAKDDPSSYVARDLAVIRRAHMNLDRYKMTEPSFVVATMYLDRAFNTLCVTGYGVSLALQEPNCR